MSSFAGSLGWTCTQCTFKHHAPADRCSMCNQLRITPKHMQDFVNGVPIPKECRIDPLFSRKAPDGNGRDSENRPPLSSQTAKGVIVNPYATKSKTQSLLKTHSQSQSDQQQQRVVKELPSAVHPGILRPFEPTAKRQLVGEDTRKPSSTKELCTIFQPRPAVLRLPQQQQLPFTPGPSPLDSTLSKEWIFPVDDDYPKRDYQLEISQAAILENTLVSLPTGLGKTLIAAVVMYNFHRFFPRGKILFLAPTLPLVNQQVQACFNIMGIPEADTAVLTGKINPARRAQLWNEKRVFYCTPQTIQFDLQASRCNPDLFVCIVLDEAHRATGNHSYVAIVNKLFESNAKFRLLGLSATPGKTIKDIQAIIDVLRISKIEARTEDDASISKYIHDRAVEEVMVPNVSVGKDVERMLNDLLLVQLDKLRSRGAVSGSLDNYQYMTSHQLRKMQERLPDTSLSGIFHIATTLCDLRTKVHVNGLACVHSVMKRLLSSRQMGPMSAFLKSEGLMKVWDVVENGKDTAANNPKLVKLREILTEHFERDRANGRSSRTIVFSQFRDSVSEIVSTLQSCSSLIRPRHFIGQGNRNKGSEGQLQGMNQAEQQEVIRQFRSDVYNVLVCTSIGEEGLDIGEVDLIVNYDVVRSAIRSIQRIGRTGRKRNGRVVVLVSEGQEKKSYDSSKHSVGTLARALKSNKFKVILGEPLFPTNPRLREKTMAVTDGFRSSQVEGHEGAKKRGRDTGNLDDKATNNDVSLEWKLSESQKEYLFKVTPTFLESDYPTFESLPRDLSRRFLTGRRLSFARNDKRLTTRGRTSSMLHRIECSHSSTSDIVGRQSSSLPTKFSSDFKYRWFPLKQSVETEVRVNFDEALESVRELDVPISETDRQEIEKEEIRLAPSPCTKKSKIVTCNTYRGSSKISEGALSSGPIFINPFIPREAYQPDLSQPCPPQRHLMRNPYTRILNDGPPVSSSISNTSKHKVIQPTRTLEPSEPNRKFEQNSSSGFLDIVTNICNPLHKTTTNETMEHNPSKDVAHMSFSSDGLKDEWISPQSTTGNRDIEPIESAVLTSEKCSIEKANERTSLHTISGSHDAKNHTRDEIESANVNDKVLTPEMDSPERDDVFMLPSQSDCSSSSDDDSDHKDATTDTMKIPAPSTEEFEFCLPSPASSCSVLSREAREDAPKRFKYPSAQKSLFCDPAYSNELSAAEHSQAVDSPDDDIIFRRGNKPRKRRAIFDATQCTADETAQVHQPQEALKNCLTPFRDLTNTQEPIARTAESRVDEIVCAVCFSGDSPDEDPIVLCDGHAPDSVCNLAVHTTCYSISVDFRDNAEWRCDPCDFLFKGFERVPIFCLSCGNSDGALKRVDGSIFHHITCNQLSQRKPTVSFNCSHDTGSIAPKSTGSRNKEEVQPRQNKLRQRAAVRKFFDEEAGIDSDEDMDGDLSEDEDIEAIEDEEADVSGFINDTSQLGYTPDELDLIDTDTNLMAIHQEFDNMLTRAQQFNTPILNRRMRDAKGRDSLGSADSAKGLGNMHFIRSVLEHHRQGGSADDIEEHFNKLEEEASPLNEDLPESPEPLSRQVIYYEPSDSDED